MSTMGLHSENARHLLFGALRLIVVPLALIWLLGHMAGSDWVQLTAISPVWLIVALLVNQLALATFAARMRWVLLTAKIEISWLAAMRIHLQSMFYFVVLPMTVGLELARYFKICAINSSATMQALAGALLLDRLIGAFAALLLAVVCLPFVDLRVRFDPPRELIWMLVIAAVLVFCGLWFWPRLRHLLSRLWALTAQQRLRLIGLLLLSMFMHVLFAHAVQLAGHGLGLPITFIDACFAVAGGMLLVVIPVSFAGLGPAEVGAAALFLALGYQPSVAIAAGALPYFLRLIGAVEGGIWELIEGGASALAATRRVLERRNLLQSL